MLKNSWRTSITVPTGQPHGAGGVYVYHTKINTKPAIEGTVWMWHQDYGSWQRDGCPRPDMATFAVMITAPTAATR